MENKIIAIRDYNNFLGLFSLQKITLPVGAQLSSFESRWNVRSANQAGLDFLKTHNIRYSIYDKEAIYQ
jgi:hypothetical protein